MEAPVLEDKTAPPSGEELGYKMAANKRLTTMHINAEVAERDLQSVPSPGIGNKN